MAILRLASRIDRIGYQELLFDEGEQHYLVRLKNNTYNGIYVIPPERLFGWLDFFQEYLYPTPHTIKRGFATEGMAPTAPPPGEK